MEIISIPDIFITDQNHEILLHDYQSKKEGEKYFVNLTKNTFSFLIDGRKEVISNASLSIENSAFLLMKSGHCLMTEKLSPLNHNYRSILLFFSNEEIFELLRTYDLPKKEVKQEKATYSFTHDAFTKSLLKTLMESSKLPTDTKNRILQLQLKELLLYLVEGYGTDFLYSLVSHNNDQTRHFISVVENSKLKKLSLRELAFLSNMSVSSFKREFEKHYSEAPIKWFQDKRLEYASFLLKHEQLRPSDIHLEVGYENLSSFVQAFKGKYGVTPKQFQHT